MSDKSRNTGFPTEADTILRHMLKCGPYEMPNPSLSAFVNDVAALVDVANHDPHFPNYAPPFEKRLRSTQTIALAVATWRKLKELHALAIPAFAEPFADVVAVPGTENLKRPGCECGNNETFDASDVPFGKSHDGLYRKVNQ